jgi:hypothetical protein
MPNLPFQNPYSETPNEDLVRLQSMVDIHDYRHPQALRLKKGTVNTMVNILFQKVVAECRRRGYNDVTSCKDFEQFVANCAVVAPSEVDILAYNKITQPTKKGKKNG